MARKCTENKSASSSLWQVYRDIAKRPGIVPGDRALLRRAPEALVHDVPTCRACGMIMQRNDVRGPLCRQQWRCRACNVSVTKGCFACASLSGESRRATSCDEVIADGVARWQCRMCRDVWLPSSLKDDLEPETARADCETSVPMQDVEMDRGPRDRGTRRSEMSRVPR